MKLSDEVFLNTPKNRNNKIAHHTLINVRFLLQYQNTNHAINSNEIQTNNHVISTHIILNKTILGITLPKNDHIVEEKSIFPAALPLEVSGIISVSKGIVWEATNTGIKNKANATTNKVPI